MDLVSMFFEEMGSRINESKEALRRLLENPEDYSLLETIFRDFHTMKGSASLVGMKNFQKVFHNLEDILKEWRENPSMVDQKSVVNMINTLEFLSSRKKSLSEGDLEEVERILNGEGRFTDEGSRDLAIDKEIKEMLEDILDSVVELETYLKSGDIELSEALIGMLKKKLLKIYERTKYVRLSEVLTGFEDLVLKDALDTGKKVRLNLNVEGAMVEKEDASVLRDSLIHVVRNAIVHGIEKPDFRKELGKSEYGQITITAFIDGGELTVKIEDDGRGIDLKAVERKVKKLGLSVSNPIDAIFLPEFSTSDSVDERSGRGVGLSAVKDFIGSRKGTVDIETHPGKGTKFILRIPLRRYLKRCLILRRGESIFAVKADDVDEVIKVEKIFTKDRKTYISHENKIYEVVDLSSGEAQFAVISRGFAVVADEILEVRDTPLKMSDISVPFVIGFALGLGMFPVPVIDPSKLEKRVTPAEGRRKVLVVDDSPLTRLVIMRILERAGYDVIGVPSFERAVKAVTSDDFDYAIVDLELPDGNGIDLVRELKRIKPSLHLAILTTADTEDNRVAAEKAGADAFLSKSSDIDKILSFMKGDV